jgi:hypothetical protein
MKTRNPLVSILAAAITCALAGSAVSALAGNTVTGNNAVVSGGDQNTASGNYSSIGGGQGSTTSGDWSTIAGGDTNKAGGLAAAIGGGSTNTSDSNYTVVAGGKSNLAGFPLSTICGGENNTSAGNFSTVCGGLQNSTFAEGAVVPGGEYNFAGAPFSFTAGLNASTRTSAEANNSNGDIGTFVWADATGYSGSNLTGTEFQSSGSNQFLIRANGGFGLNDTPPSKNIAMTIASTASNDNRAQIYLHQHNSSNGILIIGGDATSGSDSKANDASFYISQYDGSDQTRRLTLDANGNFKVTAQASKPGGGSWASSSDGRLKKNVQPLEHALDRLLALRGVTFEYAQHDGDMHPPGTFTGFIAQEVQPTFPNWVGRDEEGYLTVGPQGFEALTVEALRQLKTAGDARLAELESENAALREQLAEQLKSQAASIAQLREQVASLAATTPPRVALATTPED